MRTGQSAHTAGPIRGPRGREGFTLIELMLVVLLIVTMFGIAMPRLMPAITYGEHEAAARRLANYGRAAVAESALRQERYTVRIDLEAQEYWTVRWPGMGASLATEFEDELDGASAQQMAMMAQQHEENMDMQAELMNEQMERFARLSAQSRMRNVRRDGFLAEVGQVFEWEFSLDDEEEETEEVRGELLRRGRPPEGVTIESVVISGRRYGSGLAEVDVTPAGLAEPVTLYVESARGEFFTVVWDPITGGAHIRQGREEAPE